MVEVLIMVFAGWFVFTAANAGPQVGGEVQVKTNKYGELLKSIREQRGKIVLVDLWGDLCLLCKREFPTWSNCTRENWSKNRSRQPLDGVANRNERRTSAIHSNSRSRPGV